MLKISIIAIIAHICISLQQTNSKGSIQFPTSGRMLQTQQMNCTFPSINTGNIIQLGNCGEGQLYIFPISIGTPLQTQYCILETVGNFIYLTTQPNNIFGFNISASTSVQVSNNYVDIIDKQNGNTIKALQGQDVIQINETKIELRTPLYFVDQDLSTMLPEMVSGVIGLGTSSVGQNLLEYAYSSNQIGTGCFTISLNQNSNESSVLYFNSLPPQITQNSIHIIGNSHEYFSLYMIGFFIGQNEYTHAIPTEAILDSATPYFYLPSKAYTYAVNHFFNYCTINAAVVSCDCSQVGNWPTFTFMFEGAQVYIPPDYYVVTNVDGSCRYGFSQNNNGYNTVYLGTSFFFGYNVTFNGGENKIGLQGNITRIQVLDSDFFEATQYLELCIIIGISIFAFYLVWFMRVVKKVKVSKLSEISLTDRFIDIS